MIRLYIAISLVAAVGLGYWRYSYVVSELSAVRAELNGVSGVLDKERQNAQEAANRSLAFRIEESNREEELIKLRDCVAAGTCGIRMRYQACPKLPATTAGGSETTGDAAEPERQFQQWYFNHLATIDKYELMVAALQKEVEIRSSPDYCQPK